MTLQKSEKSTLLYFCATYQVLPPRLQANELMSPLSWPFSQEIIRKHQFRQTMNKFPDQWAHKHAIPGDEY